MGLVLFAILFMFGAIGMERRRGIVFSTTTGILLFAWVLPMSLQQIGGLDAIYIALAASALLIIALLMSVAFYFAGRTARSIFTHAKGDRTN